MPTGTSQPTDSRAHKRVTAGSRQSPQSVASRRMEGAQKSAGTVVIIAPFCSVRVRSPQLRLPIANLHSPMLRSRLAWLSATIRVCYTLFIATNEPPAIIATTVEYERTILHHGKGRVRSAAARYLVLPRQAPEAWC